LYFIEKKEIAVKLVKGHNENIKHVRADWDHLRKLFIMPDTSDKFIEFGQDLLDLIHSFFQDKGGIHSTISIPELQKLFSDINIPQSPHLLKDVLGEIKNKIIAHSVKVGNPYYIGHMTSAIPYFMILIEMIITALNQNQVKIESAKSSTFVEREYISWMHRLIYNKTEDFYRENIQNHEISLGNITLDGTMANLTAMLVARNRIFPPEGRFPGIRKAGLHEAYRYYNCKKAVILVSNRGHYSFDKIARIMGIGDENCIKVPVGQKDKIDIREVAKIINEINEANSSGGEQIKIISLVGIAGTTETGNIDNLVELANIAEKNDIYYHVDAAWGGAVLLVDDFRYLLKGVERADSVTIDAHKLLYSPVSMGMVFFKDRHALGNLRHYSNYIIRTDSVDLGRFSIEGSRPFSSLIPWTALKVVGRDGFKIIFEHAFELTSSLRGLVERHCNFEPMNHPELFIFNYRFVPKEVYEKLNSLMLQLNGAGTESDLVHTERVNRINNVLNDLNIDLHKALRDEDNSFVSRTTIDSPVYFYQRIVILRSITINPLTTPRILKEILNEQDKLGLKIYNSEYRDKFNDI
jgi:glutamate decarboxylase